MTPNSEQLNLLHQKLGNHLEMIYDSLAIMPDTCHLATELISLMGLDCDYHQVRPHHNNWDQSDIALISYADSVIAENETPLETLNHFLEHYVKGVINNIHILPFFPFCSDDGFAVIDYYQVNPSVGDWSHINAIAKDYRLMADLVINHCSNSSEWFQNFIKGEGTGYDYFYTADVDASITQVVRPRTSPLLRKTETVNGKWYTICLVHLQSRTSRP